MEELENHLRIKNDTQFLSQVREMLSNSIVKTGLSRKEENKVILAVDEAITNIMEHAYENRREGWIDITIKANDKELRITIQDSGKRFDPNSIEDPDVFEHVKEGRKEGLGIFLMRQVMDEVQYRFKEGEKNEILLVKYIKGA